MSMHAPARDVIIAFLCVQLEVALVISQQSLRVLFKTVSSLLRIPMP